LLPEQARGKIKEILGEHIEFEGHFDKVFGVLKDTRQTQLIDWIKSCHKGNEIPISSDKVKDLLGFVLKFRETHFRAILTKKKNEFFIALFLDKHKYYEDQRRKLGL